MSAPSVARGPYRNGIRRREQIVSAAAEVFAEFGYAGGSIRAIAERVGVAPASLLQHFGSKEGLLEAVLEYWTQQTQAQQHVRELRGLAAVNSLRTLMVFHVQHRGLLELFVTMAAEATSVSHPARAFIQERYATGLAEQAQSLREARDLGEIAQLSDQQIEVEASLLWAILDGLELQWLLDSRVDLVGLFDRYLDTSIARWRTGSTLS